MAKRKQQPVDTIYGIPIYFNAAREMFEAEWNGKEFQAERLRDIRKDIKDGRPILCDEPIIYDSVGEMILTKIIEITPHGSLITGPNRRGVGVAQSVDATDRRRNVYPQTEKNLEIYDKAKKMRDEGWALIHQSKQFTKELEEFPANYWIKKAQQIKAEIECGDETAH